MSKMIATIAAVVGAAGLSPAVAATYMMGGTTGLASSLTLPPIGSGATLTLRARTYLVAPTALSNTAQFLGSSLLGRTSTGIGSCSEGGVPGFNDCGQTDSEGLFNEALQLSFSTAVSLNSLRLSMVDSNDTLRLYGLGANGSLNLIGFGGTISGGLGGSATSLFAGAQNGGTYDVSFASPAVYSTYYLTQHNNSADGFRLDSLTAGPTLPEPETWALMMGGFLMVGARVRRQRSVTC